MNHPIWSLEQARKGNGPFTLVGSKWEPGAAVWQRITTSALPARMNPRTVYQKYTELMHEWNNIINIPQGTPRPWWTSKGSRVEALWSDEVVREVTEVFQSEMGLTPNMLPWLVEEAVKETLETPHPGNMLNTMSSDTIDSLTDTDDACAKERLT
eukprot:521022-Amphidinium_carterae.2